MKKFLSVFLTVILLFSAMSICANAESAPSYECHAEVAILSDHSLTPDDFAYTISVNPRKILTLNNASDDYTTTINSIKTPEGVDYFTDPEAFFATYTTDDFAGSYITFDFTIEFASDLVFGELEYTIEIDGFSAPLNLGGDEGGLLGGILGDTSSDVSVKLPTTITASGIIAEFPQMDVSTIDLVGIPNKNSYTDAQSFDPTGIEINLSLTNGKSGTIVYSEENAHAFTFVPTINEKLSVYDTEVAMLLNGVIIGYTPITVEHQWSAGPVNITTDKYTSNKPGYHAIVCEGCGETHDAQPHIVDEEAWTYNNDETFVANGTESNTCLDCGTVLIRDTFGTAGFNTAFADMHFIKVIFEYINVLLRFIGAATY